MQGSPNTELGGSAWRLLKGDLPERVWGGAGVTIITELGGSAWRLLSLQKQMRQSSSACWLPPQPCLPVGAGRICLQREGGGGGGGDYVNAVAVWNLLAPLLMAAGAPLWGWRHPGIWEALRVPAHPPRMLAVQAGRQALELTEQATDGQGQGLEDGEVHIQPLPIHGVGHLHGWKGGRGEGTGAHTGC